MKHLIAIITFLAFISPAYSQQIFETVVGNAGDDVGYSVRQTSDGFTVVGYTTNSNTNKDWYLVELDSAGVVVNSKYDKLLSDQYLADLQITYNGHYEVAGTRSIFFNNYTDDFALANLVPNPTTIGNNYWGTYTGNDAALRVSKRRDDKFIISGFVVNFPDTQAMFLLLNRDGLVEAFPHFFGGAGAEWINDVAQLPSRHLMLLGSSNSFGAGSRDLFISKFDSADVSLWAKSYGTTGEEEPGSIYYLPDQSLLVCGGVKDISGQHYATLFKCDTEGVVLWSKKYSIPGKNIKATNALTRPDGTIMINLLDRDTTDARAMVMKTDEYGNYLYAIQYDGLGNSRGYMMDTTLDGGYIICGSTQNPGISNADLFVIKTDSNGVACDATLITVAEDTLVLQVDSQSFTPVIKTDNSANNSVFKKDSSENMILCSGAPEGNYLATILMGDSTLCQKFCTNFSVQSVLPISSWQWNFEGGSPSSSMEESPENICYNTSGTFDVTLIVDGNSGPDTIFCPGCIHVFETPPIPEIQQNNDTLLSTSAYTYQWQLNAEDILGATNQFYVFTQQGFYSVVVSDSNGCKNQSATIFVGALGGDQIFGETSLQLFPNPTSGILFLRTNTNVPDGQLEIINDAGRIMKSFDLNITSSSESKIDLSSFPDELYLIIFRDHQNSFQEKISLIK